MKEFVKLLNDGTEEYLNAIKNGEYVSIEFSTNRDNYDGKIEEINIINESINNDNIKWVMFYCEVCFGHCNARPYHVEIIHKVHDKEYIRLNNILVG